MPWIYKGSRAGEGIMIPPDNYLPSHIALCLMQLLDHVTNDGHRLRETIPGWLQDKCDLAIAGLKLDDLVDQLEWEGNDYPDGMFKRWIDTFARSKR